VPILLDSNGKIVLSGTIEFGDVEISDVTINNEGGAAAVNIQDGGNTITVDGTVAFSNTTIAVTQGTAANLNMTEANSGAIKTAVELIDNAISGNEMQVDVLTMPTTTVTASALDIRALSSATDGVLIYGSDDGGTTKRIVKTDSGGAIQVDIEVATVTANAGTNLNTSALALEAGGNLAGINGKITACNTGAVVVSSGAITETNSADIKTAIEILDNAISGNEMQVDVVTIPDVVITSGAVTATLANSAKIDCNGSAVVVSGTATNTPVSKTGLVLTADGQVKATAGVVYAVQVSGIGVTAGDKVEIKNSADNSGTALVTMVADAANGTWAFYPSVGITFDTGIYSDETKSGGTFTATIVYG
jgi:hypothetical protein